MRKVLYTIFFAAIGIFLISSSNGRATVASQGNTGAPGDNAKTCSASSCHSNTIPMDIVIEMRDGADQLVTEYIPGATYRVRVTLNSDSNPRMYGFQITSLIDESEEDIETWANVSPNAKLANAGNRQYVEQAGPSQTNTFEASWTAPSDDEGTVTFYAAGVGVNGNGNFRGDGGAEISLQITSPSTGTNDINVASLVKRISKNPVESVVSYELNPQYSFDISVVDASGRVLNESKDQVGNYSLPMSDFNNGLYFFVFKTENGIYTEKVMK